MHVAPEVCLEGSQEPHLDFSVPGVAAAGQTHLLHSPLEIPARLTVGEDDEAHLADALGEIGLGLGAGLLRKHFKQQVERGPRQLEHELDVLLLVQVGGEVENLLQLAVLLLVTQELLELARELGVVAVDKGVVVLVLVFVEQACHQAETARRLAA